MSSYANFYLRVNDNFAPIASYSRSSIIYQTVSNYVPYERLVAIRPLTINEWINTVKELKVNVEASINRYQNIINQIFQANNSIQEKLEAVEEYKDLINEERDTIEELESAFYFFGMLDTMIEEYKYGDEADKFENDEFHYLYVGIECPGGLKYVEDTKEN